MGEAIIGTPPLPSLLLLQAFAVLELAIFFIILRLLLLISAFQVHIAAGRVGVGKPRCTLHVGSRGCGVEVTGGLAAPLPRGSPAQPCLWLPAVQLRFSMSRMRHLLPPTSFGGWIAGERTPLVDCSLCCAALAGPGHFYGLVGDLVNPKPCLRASLPTVLQGRAAVSVLPPRLPGAPPSGRSRRATAAAGPRLRLQPPDRPQA